MHLTPSLVAATLLTLSSAVRADDWPQFQGPERTGRSAETGLARSWPDGGPPVLWATSLEGGYGGAAVRDGEVFVMDRLAERADAVRCLGLADGTERWRYEYEAPGRLPYNGSRTVPTVTERHVLAVGSFGQVHCIDRATHAPLWSVDLTEDLAGELPAFGWSQSPLLYTGPRHGDTVIVAPLGPEAGLAALDARTGTAVWTSPGLGSSHSNPILVTLGGTRQLIFQSRHGDTGMVTGLDPDTGTVLWQSNAYVVKRSIPAPTVIGESRLFLTGGYRAGSAMLDIAREDETWTVREVFRVPRGAQIHLPILHQDHLYLLVNENWNDKRRHEQGGLMCMDLAGEERWRTGDSPYLGRGPMLFADGMLIVLDGYNGTLRLVNPTPAAFEVIAQAGLFGITDDEDHGLWAPMALTDGRLLVRSQDELKCVDLRRSPATP
jgi:outer membrane protein assembly factor BamB